MIAHARWLRHCYGGNSYIVFIGPCIAKKQEMLDGPVSGEVEAALTFQELMEWMNSEAIPPLSEISCDVARCPCF
jgi:iron only hydrogenase large subunit-like protein